MSDFARLLRRKRKEADLNQAHLARSVGIDQQTVSRWERGVSTPNQDMLSRIARAFGEPEDKWFRVAGGTTVSEPFRILPPVRPLMDRLPLGELTSSEFERFASYFLGAYYPSANVARVGGPGHAQGGADILVRTSEGIYLFQCKRKKRFGPAQMRSAASAAAATAAEKRVVMLSRVATPDARMAATSVGWQIWDHDDIVRMLQQEVSPESALRVLKPFFSGWTEHFLGIRGPGPWARPAEYFAGLTEESTYSHSYGLVGRDDEVVKVLEWARGEDKPFLLVTGAAGVGKTRFLMEIAHRVDVVAGRSVVRFLDSTATVELEDFGWLFDDDRPFVVVDDAHDRDDLDVIIRGSCSSWREKLQPRVLLTTRDYGKPRILAELAKHAHELDPPTVHLAQLKLPDARRLASEVLGIPINSPRVMRLAALTRDCTLLLVAAGYFLKTRYVDPAFLDDEEGFRAGVLERMYQDYVEGAGQLTEISVEDVLRFLATVHPFDLDDEEALGAVARVLRCPRDMVALALEKLVKTGVVVKRGSRLRVQPDLLADHILASSCFSRTLRRATGYARRVWRASNVGLRQNLIVNVARIDWRLSASGMSHESMLSEVWHVLEREFKESGIPARLDLLNLLERVAFYQPERTLNLVEWALDHELRATHTPLVEYTYQDVRIRVAPVLRVCAYHLEWLGRVCELLWSLALSDQRPTNPFPDHPLRILCDLAAYSVYKPFKSTQSVIGQAIKWLRRDRTKLVFEILDQALRREFDDHISDGHTVTFYPYSALDLGKERVLALRSGLLCLVIQQILDKDAPLAVRAAKSLGLALSPSFGNFGRKRTVNETIVWQSESVKVLKRLRDQLSGTRLAPVVVVALKQAVEQTMRDSDDAIGAIVEEVLAAVADDLDHQVVEVLIHGPWRWHRRQMLSPDEAQVQLKDLACRLLEDSVDTSTATRRVEQHLAEIGASSDAAGAGNFVAELVHQRLGVGIEIIDRVIADENSPLIQVTGVTLSAIRAANQGRALELAHTLVNTDRAAARMSVAYAYGWGLARAPAVSNGELDLILRLAADDNVRLAHRLSDGLRFMAERDPRMALTVIRAMRIGRWEELAGEVLGLFAETGPLRVDELSKDELHGIVEELVACNEIDDYWIQAFLASVSRNDMQSIVRLLQRRVEHAESLDGSNSYCPLPYRWHEKWELKSQGTHYRRRILEDLRDWATEDDCGWRRHYEAPRLFAAVANEFDNEVLGVIGLGLKAPPAIARNVANLLTGVPRGFAWSHVQWIVRTLDDAARRDVNLYRAIGSALHSALMSGVRSGTPGEPFPEDVAQRDRARNVADGLPAGSPGERFYRSLQRGAEHEIESKRDMDEDRDWA